MVHFVTPTKEHIAIKGDSFASIAAAKNIAFERLKLVNTGKGAKGKALNYDDRTPAFSLDIGDTVGIPDAEEVLAIAAYMAGEMNANAHGVHARNMRRLMDDANTLCPTSSYAHLFMFDSCSRKKVSQYQVAMAMWTFQVMQGAAWDHKPIIAKKFIRQGVSKQEKHLYVDKDFNEYSVFYDIWSNFHYGYVAIACGFSEKDMLDGAGLEQFGSDLWRGSTTSVNAAQSGLAKFDDPKDNAAIKAGFALWYKKSNGVTAQDVLDLMLSDTRFKRLRDIKNV